MGPKSMILMRHAEREDRAAEEKGIDWISTAPRPQDPFLSEKGFKQASEVGRQLIGKEVTRILCSPMIRTVQTAECIAEQLGLGNNSICVEMGLVEEAKSHRGKMLPEPRPNWNPLILPVSELCQYSSRIDTSYVSLRNVEFIRDEEALNTVREVHPDSSLKRDEITKDRTREVAWLLVNSEKLHNETILCVGHGATVGGITKALENDLDPELKVAGEKTVSCYSQFAPVDAANVQGPWKSVSGIWHTGDIFQDSADNLADRGFAPEPVSA